VFVPFVLVVENHRILLGIHVLVEINGVWVGRGRWCFASRLGPIATLRAGAGSNEAHGGTSLTFESGHGIGTVCVFLALLAFAVLGALLAASNGLRCNEVDIGTVR
jgi:hypothetical protein